MPKLNQWAKGLFFAVVGFALLYPFLSQEPELSLPAPEQLHQPVPDFARYENVDEKKQAFFDYLRPAVEYHNQIILNDRNLLQAIRQKMIDGLPLSRYQKTKLAKLSQAYKLDSVPSDVDGINRLLRRVDIVPVELVLVQAANESAWGTSRFARQGFNFFGMWCFRKGCGFVPKQRDDDAGHEVAKFKDLSHAVKAYLTNINSHYAYSELRGIRAGLRRNQQTVTAEYLVEGLMSYSERGQDYIDELLHMIRTNRKYLTS
ncbi:glucosaminidase domain-containing protein [Bowmanella pacifica]|uniref:Glycoside hydrolase family 73 n=2 Tax=Bowmanella TaxID=366580 RepID=A0A917YY91_9ALTE|nr:glucosaminidase domain-containing protein [Bowmanella pacifica]GGO69685.1 glycoside hydrolase family 73 [Bowmanella pacifica]